MSARDLIGRRFDQWHVLATAATINRKSHWLARCDCGTERAVAEASLIRGLSTNCGCARKAWLAVAAHDLGRKHGMRNTRTYSSWRSMVQRCNLPTSASYERYGAAGVSVCDRWREFANFFADMGERPAGTSLDRWPNSAGNYEPGNCRWGTPVEQSRNRRNVAIIAFGGVSQTLVEWAQQTGIGYSTLRERLHSGWSVERALTTPANPARDPRLRRHAASTGAAP